MCQVRLVNDITGSYLHPLPFEILCRNALLSAVSSRTNVRDLRFLLAVEMTETATEMRCRIAIQSLTGQDKGGGESKCPKQVYTPILIFPHRGERNFQHRRHSNEP